MSDFHVDHSWAIEPYYYHAPYPETSDGSFPGEYQHAAAEYVLARAHALIADAPGVGKAQPLDAKVRIPGGWARIGDLKVGDGICGYDGRGGRVVGIYDRGIMDVYEVTFNDGSSTRVSEDHLWRVQSPGSEWFVAPTWLIEEKIKTSKIWIPQTRPVGASDHRRLPVEPYLLGLLLGGGSLSQGGVCMTTADAEIEAYCTAQAEKWGLRYALTGDYSGRFSGHVGVPNPLLDALRGLSCIGKLSHQKSIPSVYLYGPASARLELLRGLMDADGWRSGKHTGFTSTSEDLAGGVIELVQSLGGTARLSRKENEHRGCWNVSINSPVNPFRLERKASAWHPHPHYKPRRLFKSIEYVGREPVRCINVTCSDRLYLTDHYIVTHNTLEVMLVDNAIESNKTLVICPASLRLNWEREIWKWSTKEGVTTYPVLKSSDGASLEHDFVIISYQLLRSAPVFDAIMDGRWDHLICDEAHAFKDYKGNITSNLICGEGGVHEVCGRMTFLTGTPMPNTLIEIYNTARLLNWDSIDRMSAEAFREYYYTEGGGFVFEAVEKLDKETGNTYTIREQHWSNKVRNKPRHQKELQERLRSNFMVRRLKEQVLDQLPEQTWHPFPLVEDAGMRRALKHPGWEQVDKLYEMDPDAFISRMPVDGAVSTALRELGEAKVPAVVDYIENLLAEGTEKIVVGAWHRQGPDGPSVLPMLREKLKKHGLVYMDGTTSARKKQDAVDEFQGNPKIKIILGQMMSMGEGHTLTAAQDVVFAEFYWTGGKMQQFFDRISRRGQDGSYTLGHLPIVPNSHEERMLHRVIEKETEVHEGLDKRD